MIADFQCISESCGGIMAEGYYPTLAHMQEELAKARCPKCGGPMRRIFGGAFLPGGEIPGYEKKNKDRMTIGKAFDQSRSKWV